MSGECNRCGEHCIECRCRPGDMADLSICRRRQSDRPVGDELVARIDRATDAAIAHVSSCMEPPDKMEDWFTRNMVREIVIVAVETAGLTDLQTRLSSMKEALVDLVDALRGENGLSARACFELEAASKALSDGGVEG
jgi:hypothetical protein